MDELAAGSTVGDHRSSSNEVVIDLTLIDHLETAMLDLLCWEVEHDDTGSPARAVRFALTESPPTESSSSSARTHVALAQIHRLTGS